MKNAITRLPRSRFLISALLIGGLISLQNYGMFLVFPDSTPYWFLPLLISLFASYVLATSIIQHKRLEPWAFPAFGGLLLELWWFLSVWQPRTASIYLYALLTISTVVGLAVIYKRKKVVPTYVKVIAGAVIVLIALLQLFRTATDLDFFSAVLLSLLILTVHTIPILALGLLLAQKYGQTAILLVTACTPFFLEEYLDNDISYSIMTSYALETRIAVALFQLIPFFVFLILIPVLSMTTEAFKVEKPLLACTSFLAIGSIAFIRVFYLQAPDALFSLVPWAMWIHFLILLSSPILFAILLYNDYQPNASTREVVVGA